MLFSRVIMAHSGQPEIAKVNRQTGVLFLNSKIWDQLPADQKDFVLFHEDGHLRLDTADEFAANQYAVDNFVPAGRFNNNELGKRIIVMREILSKADNDYSNFSGDFISDSINGVFQGLSILGIGSKARAIEAAANAQTNALNSNTAVKANTKYLLIGGTLLIVGIVIYFTLKK